MAGWKSSETYRPSRRKPVSRSLAEAEAELLSILQKLEPSACADASKLAIAFASASRASSECQSALKGRELAGDLGWLDDAKEAALKQAKGALGGPKPAIKSVVPDAVLKVAFQLEIGELSDIISSELGAHLLLRAA